MWLDLTLVIFLSLLALVGWAANVLGMPGNWLVVILAVCCLFRPEEFRSHLDWIPLASIVVMALLGEALEFAASALGVSRLGASRRSAALAIVGSIGGAIFGLFAGTLIPIPIVGNLVASLMLGALGAFGGAVLGERWVGKDWDESLQVGSAAFWGRLLGTVGKAVCGTAVSVIFVVAIWY